MESEELHLKRYVEEMSPIVTRVKFCDFMEEWAAFYRNQFVELDLDFTEVRFEDEDDDCQVCEFFVLQRDRTSMGIRLVVRHMCACGNEDGQVDVRFTIFDDGKFRAGTYHQYNCPISEILDDQDNVFRDDIRRYLRDMSLHL